ncbi:MAG TPA: YihY/virulence factor BrkB family protein [Gammaproteobacteria bacterium]
MPRRLGLVRALRLAWVEYERDRARYFAAAMAYYAFVSLVPLLLLLLSVLGLMLRFSDDAAEVERQVLEQIEVRFGSELHETIQGLLDALQQESVGATALAVAGLLLAASVLFRHLRMTFRAVWKRDPPLIAGRVRSVVRETILERALSFVMVIGGGALLLAALAMMTVSQWIARTFGGLPRFGATVERVLPPAGSLLLAAATFAILYKVLPPVRLRFRDVALAVLVSTIAWGIATEVLALYGLYLGSTPSASGAFGGLLVLMLWMSAVFQMLFFGAELCKVVAGHRTRPPPE